MLPIGVAEDEGGVLGAALRRELAARGAGGRVRACAAGGRYGLLLCTRAALLPPETRARILAVPFAEGQEAARRCRARRVLTCGLDPRSTVTPSSLLAGGMATLQRELEPLRGRPILPRELALPSCGPPEGRLLLAAALLALGLAGE